MLFIGLKLSLLLLCRCLNIILVGSDYILASVEVLIVFAGGNHFRLELIEHSLFMRLYFLDRVKHLGLDD